MDEDIKANQSPQQGQNGTRSNLLCSVPVLKNVFDVCASGVKQDDKSVVNVIDAAAKNGLSDPQNVEGAKRNRDALKSVMDGMNAP